MPGSSEGRGGTMVDPSYLKVLADRICIAPSAIVAPLVASIEVPDASLYDHKGYFNPMWIISVVEALAT